MKTVLWAHFTITHAVLRGSTEFLKTTYSGHPSEEQYQGQTPFESHVAHVEVLENTFNIVNNNVNKGTLYSNVSGI